MRRRRQMAEVGSEGCLDGMIVLVPSMDVR